MGVCSPPFGRGWGRGAASKEKSKLLVCAGFQPARDLFWVSTRSCAPPLHPSQWEGNLLNQSFPQFVVDRRLRQTSVCRQAKAFRTSNCITVRGVVTLNKLDDA